MNRRSFLAALGVGAATITVSCSGDDEGPDSGPADSSGGATSAPASTTTLAVPTANFATDPFMLGVASGDPLPTSVILWTRLALDPTAEDGMGGVGERPVDLLWEVARDESFDEIVGQGIVTADPENGHSIHLEATDLEPNSFYWFRFKVDTYTSPSGRTRTMPNEDDDPQELRFAFASCQNYPNGYYTAHAAIAEDQLDLLFWLGDYIYESGSSEDSTRQVLGGRCETLADYRRRYATYASDPNLQASRGSCPWVVTWDDHEVENNYAGTVSGRDRDVAGLLTLRNAAYRAFWENTPIRIDAPVDDEEFKIYRTSTFGTLAKFFVLDGRQYRDDQPCGDADDAIISSDECADINEDRTMLGTEQESWLDGELTSATTTWKVLAQQTVMSSLLLGTIILNVDQWDGYSKARERLLSTIESAGVSDVVVLTGDIHSAGAGVISTNGENGPAVAVATEFVGTSITSGSLVDIVPGGAELVTPDRFEGIEYLNVKDHGYCRCTVTPTDWTTEFVVVDTITEETSATRIDITASVTAGSPTLAMS